ncbi:MAG TPA: hypothetical protein VLW53_04825 [Candidatus Eisenbacteria bacterium]|nr:hypothetical protein [Candidatus Eisenbacteria bacterium]
MGTKDAPVCPRHDGEVPMNLRTLHSDLSAPQQVLGVYACPECVSERRLPIATGEPGPRLAPPGAA